MPLEFRKQRDGSLRPEWFGRFEVDGKRYCLKLGVKIAGVPPDSLSLKDKGDADFEVSRGQALEKLARVVEEARTKENAAGLVQKLYTIKTGETIRAVKLAELDEHWLKIPRKRKPNARYADQCQSRLRKFTAFIKSRHPRVQELGQITRPMVLEYLDAETNRGVTGKTWNDTLKLLRAVFKYLLPNGATSPVALIPTQDSDTVFRKPFTPEELKLIVDATRQDDFLRPIVIAGICTAMRKGDCCLLRWQDVDLDRGFITVKTAKTGQTVSIPIFPLLHEELTKLPRKESGYVFPAQAAMYLENSSGISWRVKKLLYLALRGESTPEQPALAEVSDDEIRRRGDAFIASLANPEKRQRMKAVFDAYRGGKNADEIVEAQGVSKGSVSGYLTAIEDAIECRIVRGRKDGVNLKKVIRKDRELLTVKREGGKRSASIRDFHSFRVTWVTLALTAGVPLELVQKVTGHKTTDIVLKHYFQPGRDAFKHALSSAMPKLLTNGTSKTPMERIKEIVDNATEQTAWKAIEAIKKVLDERAKPALLAAA